MPSPVICPSCGERLDIPADLRGAPVRCAACANVFTPPPADGPANVPEVGPSRPSARPARPTDEEYADDRDRPRRKRGGGWVWILLGGLGLMSCLCCGGCGGLFWWSENPTFQAHTDPAGRFTAEFPGTPHTTQLAIAPKETLDGVETVREMTKESYFVYCGDRPRGKGIFGKDDTDQLLQDLATKVALTKRGKEQFRNPLTHKGYPAIDVHTMISAFEGGTVFRVIVTDKRIYVIGVSGQVLPDAPRVEHFFETFEVNPGKPAAAKDGEGKKP